MRLTQQNSNYEISYKAIMIAVGILGALLPGIVLLITFSIGKCSSVQYSLSHYYYTIAGDVFVGLLTAIALFLIAYKGPEFQDNLFTNIAGLLALLIAFFPSTNNEDVKCFLFELSNNKFVTTVHFTAATFFLLILSGISLFLFTKTKGKKTREKELRNKFYYVCGAMIFLSIIVLALFYNIDSLTPYVESYHLTFWLEWMALFSFGLSWLIKGGFILRDKGTINTVNHLRN